MDRGPIPAVQPSGGNRHAFPAGVPAGVVVTSDTHGGGEKYLHDLFGHATIRDAFPATLLGRLPRWDQTGLAAVDLGLGPKWSYRGGPRQLLSAPTARRKAIAGLRDTARDLGFGLFHMQYKREQVMFTRRASAVAPVVWTEHGRFPTGPLRTPLLATYRRAARHAAAIICVSHAVANELDMLLGRGAPRITVIENAVDTGWLTEPSPAERDRARASLGVPAEAAPVIAVVSRLAPTKRIDLVLSTALGLDDARVLVCGDGPSRSDLMVLGRDLGDRARFTGFMEDTRDAYRAADVLVLPTDGSGEGLPLALLEAACANIPAVVVADSGLGGLVEGWGAVAGEATPHALERAISDALAQPKGSARQWAERHNVDDWASAHAGVFESCLR